MRLFLIILMIPLTLFAFHEHDEKNKSFDEKKGVSLEETLSSAEPTLKYIYKAVNTVAKSVDEFLSNDYTPTDYTDSYIHIETSVRKDESIHSDFNTDVDLRLKLKKTSHKYKLVINNNDDNVSDEFSDHNETVPFKDNNLNVGIQYQTYKKYLNLKASLGVKATSNPYVYIKTSAGREFEISKKSKINIKQLFRYSTRFDLDSTSTIQYSKELDDTYTFVNHNAYFLNSQDKIDNLYNSLRINQKIDHRDYINYVLSLSSDNDDTEFKDKEYKVYLSYRNFLKKWLYYDLVPEVNFQRDEGFKENYAFTFNLGILIDK